ncbi:MAG: peptidoglycan-binding domain-containing protein [Rhodospirillaceae bacterium]
MARVKGLVLAVCLGLAAAGPAAARGSADLQWAQQALAEKGFDVGRPNGEMSQKTRAALSAFQRISGLTVTGELDAATTAKLLAGRPEPSGGGTLGAPQSRAQPQAPAPRDALPAKPRAVPSARIEALGGPGGEAVISSAGGAPAPRAAPSGAVSAMATGLLPGQAPAAVKDNGDAAGPLLIEAAGWVRTLVVGVIAAIFVGFAGLYWRSGRKPAHHRPARGRTREAGPGAGGQRREPSFAPPEPAQGGRELRVRRL